MARMDFSTLYHDRRRPDLHSEFDQDEGQVYDTAEEPRMSEDFLINSLRVPSALPGPGAIVLGRQRDSALCRHCGLSALSHQSAGSYHLFEQMPPRSARGVHPDVATGRARSTQPSGYRPTY